MNIRLVAAVAVLTLSASIAVAAPNGRHGGNRGRGGEYGSKFAQKLNLTDAQKAQIKAIREETRQQSAAMFQSLRQTRQELRAARAANDTARADALKATLASQRAQIQQLRDTERERIMALLTPEQLAEWEKLEKEQKEKRRGRRGKRN